ncbi:MAG: L-lactate dehydrogenase [Proteobacteria bacterium]|nr:L-lactate dehydrogenase [Pseudomonadota bacterium]
MIPAIPVTAGDYRRLAQRRLPGFLFDYIDGGASDEITLRANVDDFARIRLRQRVLVDVANIDTQATLAGQSCAMPLALAPVGLAGMMARRGEAQAARVAHAAGLPFTLSTVGICALTEVRDAAGAPPWFQLYMLRDRGVVRALIEQAWALGCRTLVFTIDLPLPGARHRDIRRGLGAHGLHGALLKNAQVLAHPRWLWNVALRGRPLHFGNLAGHVPQVNDFNALRAWIERQFDPAVIWRDIEWLRGLWPGQLLLKGILDGDDAQAAVDAGADGIVVSNHGGRQLDSAASTISKLPIIAQRVGAHTQILLDGGVRSGVDIFKALALGARGVLIGRAWIWALAGAGEAGLRALLATLQRELLLTMTLAGVRTIADIGPQHLDRD